MGKAPIPRRNESSPILPLIRSAIARCRTCGIKGGDSREGRPVARSTRGFCYYYSIFYLLSIDPNVSIYMQYMTVYVYNLFSLDCSYSRHIYKLLMYLFWLNSILLVVFNRRDRHVSFIIPNTAPDESGPSRLTLSTTPGPSRSSVCVIGGGPSGLACCRTLCDAGLQVVLIQESRGDDPTGE